MSRNLRNRLLVACASLPLTACPGGSGSYIASTPMPQPVNPPPPMSPPPSPPPSGQSPAIFPDVTTNTTFAALGLEASSRTDAVGALLRDGFSARYDAASHAYIIGLPNITPGAFTNNAIQGSRFDNVSVGTSFQNGQLAYTAQGVAEGYYTSAISFFAFGSPTPASGVPVSGSATYDASASGVTLDTDPSHFPSRTIGGSATLQFDFGAGTLSGHFDPVLNYYAGPSFTNPTTVNLGTYTFTNTVYGAGKTNFSGQLTTSGASSPGSFDGQFTGPAAQELMARWTAPYLMPDTQKWSQMFGVWVGKKH